MSLEAALIRCCCISIPPTPCAQLFAACFGWPPPPTVSVIVNAQYRERRPNENCPEATKKLRTLAIGATGVLLDPSDPGITTWPAYRIQGFASVTLEDRYRETIFDPDAGCALIVDIDESLDAEGNVDGIVTCSQCPPVTQANQCGGSLFPIAIQASIAGSFVGSFTSRSGDVPRQTISASCSVLATVRLDQCASRPCRCASCGPGNPDLSLISTVTYQPLEAGVGSMTFLAPLCDQSEDGVESIWNGSADIILS